jgi:hypothetical protein
MHLLIRYFFGAAVDKYKDAQDDTLQVSTMTVSDTAVQTKRSDTTVCERAL